VRLEHAFLAEVREELTSRNVLEEHVELSCVLRESLEGDLDGRRDTIKGCEIELRIRYSLAMWSTCCDLMISSFFMIFTQEYLPLVFFLTSRTRPNEPASRKEYPHPALSDTRNP
jgi:hypothetical protein